MKKQLTALSLVLIIFAFALGCDTKPNRSFFIDSSKPEQRQYVVDSFADERLRQIHNFHNIIGHDVYVANNEACINLRFNSQITRQEVDGARSYFGNLIYDSGMKYGATAYQNLLYENMNFDRATLRIFAGEDLLLYKSFDFEQRLETYYENDVYSIGDRQIHEDRYSDFLKSISQTSWNIRKAELVKPLKPYVYLIKVKTVFSPDDVLVDEMKALIENDLAIDLEKASIDVYGMNTNSLGIILEIKAGIGEDKTLIYFNGENKEWMKGDWQNLDFFHMNNPG